MLKLSIKRKGFDEGRRRAKDDMKKVLMLSMFKMEELAIRYAPVDRGLLRNQITVFPQILANKYILTSHAPYSAAMEYGTRPGHHAPIKPLMEWAGRKLGDSSLGYAIQAKIFAEGITAHPFIRPAMNQVKNFWIERFKKEVFSTGV